jgi:hypothetical protein
MGVSYNKLFKLMIDKKNKKRRTVQGGGHQQRFASENIEG